MTSPTAPEILYKQPSESRIYSMDFSNLLGQNTISSIISCLATSQGGDIADLVLSGITMESKRVSFTVSAGTHRNTYRIQAIVTTSDGQTLEGDGLLMVTNI